MDAIQLLKEALTKQSKLREHDYWADEIPEFCPPVLWFGDERIKPVVATVGANPSRSEFLHRHSGSYLQKPRRRFHHLETSNIKEVINDETALKKIISSYTHYFEKTGNPYKQWFGKRRGGKVEGFINGMGASFYTKKSNRAIHIDLIPFVTRTDFSKLSHFHLKRDLNQDEWAKFFFNYLINYLKPSVIVVSGKRNVEYFNEHYSKLQFTTPLTINGLPTRYGITSYFCENTQIPIIGVSTNLGNSWGFSGTMLNELGRHLGSQIEEIRKMREG